MRSLIALTVIGGLLTATLLTLVIIPGVYSIVDRISYRTSMRAMEMLQGELTQKKQGPRNNSKGLCFERHHLRSFLFDLQLFSRHETTTVLLLKFHIVFDQRLGIVPTLFRNLMTCFPDS